MRCPARAGAGPACTGRPRRRPGRWRPARPACASARAPSCGAGRGRPRPPGPRRGPPGATIPAFLEACQSNAASGSGQGNFPSHPKWKFVFVNHVTTNPFFVPTQYGIQDACAALGCDYQWTGSKNSITSEMVDAMNTAINAKADGIAIAITDASAFDEPVARALDAGIPVVAYNADAPAGG